MSDILSVIAGMSDDEVNGMLVYPKDPRWEVLYLVIRVTARRKGELKEWHGALQRLYRAMRITHTIQEAESELEGLLKYL